MKLLSRLLPWFVFAWLAGAAGAADLQAIPPFAGPVVDRAGLLDATQAVQLDRRLREFSRTHGSQIAVLIVPTTQPESIEQYSIRVFDAWKIGRKQENDGVLITVAVQDRKLRIDTGYGLEGAIPDAVARRVVMEVISPKFRGGDAYGGLAAGVEQIGKLIEGEHLPPSPQGNMRSAAPQGGQGGHSGNSGDGGGLGQVLLLGIVAATVVGGILSMMLGRFFGSVATAGIVGALAWVVGGSLFVALASVIIVFLYVLITGGHVSGWGGGGFGGGWSGGGGGGWSGGGGSAGGGGASGEW